MVGKCVTRIEVRVTVRLRPITLLHNPIADAAHVRSVWLDMVRVVGFEPTRREALASKASASASSAILA